MLKCLKLAPKTRGHIRSLMSMLFKCAQRWELIENNPMHLVRVKNVSKRLERPSVLRPEEFHKVLPHIRQPYRTMVLIAGCLGLRASEIVGLQWLASILRSRRSWCILAWFTAVWTM